MTITNVFTCKEQCDGLTEIMRKIHKYHDSAHIPYNTCIFSIFFLSAHFNLLAYIFKTCATHLLNRALIITVIILQ